MTGRVAVVAGASSGIGAALAIQLGRRGDLVALGARREQELRKIASQAGERALPVVTDVTKRSDVERLRDAALAEFGRVDVWVNNAGRGINRPVSELTDADVHGILEVVLMSTLYGMQAILPHFKERGDGVIVNVSSFLGRVPITSYRSIYSASKSAVNALSSNLRMELRSKYPKIQVCVVMPGVVDTPFHDIATPPLPARAGEMLWGNRVESAEEVAAKIVSLIDNPAPELYTNPDAARTAEGYFRDVGAFEENMARRQSR